MSTPPFPGVVAPNPRTWSPGDIITVPRLRGDMTNLAALYVSSRPLFQGNDVQGPLVFPGASQLIDITDTTVNNWNVGVIEQPLGAPNPYYFIPMAGWYLVQGSMILQTPATTPDQWKYSMGFNAVVNGAGATLTDGGANPAQGSTSTQVGMSGAELYQFNTFANTGDQVGWYVFADFQTTPDVSLISGLMMAEWVGLPTSGLTGYTGPYGTVVNPPVAAAAFPPGPGTTVTAPVSAGATSITVASNTGMVTGGTLGLDYVNGQLYQPVAEAVTITSVAGTTIGISAAAFPHSSGAPVAVPVSAAFLNQQCRDLINYLSYPPLCRVAATTTQSIPSQTFPAGTQVTNLAATVDTFSGFAANAYTIPVAGLWFVYAQVYFAGTTAPVQSWAAGISVNGGTTDWGTITAGHTSSGGQSFCMVYSRERRLNAGDVVTILASQDSGSAVSTVSAGADLTRALFLWRAF